MKTLKKMKLNQLSKDELEKRAMNAVKGGTYCQCKGCGCGSDDSWEDGWEYQGNRDNRC